MNKVPKSAASLINVLVAVLIILALFNLLELAYSLSQGNSFESLLATIQLIVVTVLAYYCRKGNKQAIGWVSVASLLGLKEFLSYLGRPGIEGMYVNAMLLMQLVLIILPWIVLARIDTGLKNLETKPSFTKSTTKFVCLWGLAGMFINFLVYVIKGMENKVFFEDNNLVMLSLALPIIALLALYAVKKDSYFGMLAMCLAISVASGLMLIIMIEISQAMGQRFGIWAVYIFFYFVFFICPVAGTAILGYDMTAMGLNYAKKKQNGEQ